MRDRACGAMAVVVVAAVAASVLGGVVSPSEAEARSFRVAQIPNGTQFGCFLCHTGSGGPRNAFGEQVENTLSGNDADWGAVYNLDADGDGFTNGEELGDPMGSWGLGDDNPTFNASDPNDVDSFPLPCGNGELDPGEECDGALLAEQTCVSLGFLRGDLRCSRLCTFDTSSCDNCGNGVRDEGENCDGEDFGDASCQALGFGSGMLACNDDCTFDEAGCSDCGNGIADGAEQCDGGDLAGQTCRTRGYTAGDLSCEPGTCTFDISACIGDPEAVCGDGAAQSDEECDGDDLRGLACDTLGFARGTLGCAIDCSFDYSGCDTCGDGVIEGVEECDGANVDGATCRDYGFIAGEVTCWDNCTLNLSTCTQGGGNNGGTNTNNATTSTNNATTSTNNATTSTNSSTGGGNNGGTDTNNATTSPTTGDGTSSGGGDSGDGGGCATAPQRPVAPVGVVWLLVACAAALRVRRRR